MRAKATCTPVSAHPQRFWRDLTSRPSSDCEYAGAA
jgi:hypothetical protein